MDHHTLPVAHQHASLASSITTLSPFALSSSAKNLAAEAPVMPEPTMTISASEGRCGVVRWPKRNADGSLCQNEEVDSVVGKLAMFDGVMQSLAEMMLSVMYHSILDL